MNDMLYSENPLFENMQITISVTAMQQDRTIRPSLYFCFYEIKASALGSVMYTPKKGLV